MRSVALLVVAARVAHADPDDFVARPLVLAQGQLEAELITEINVAPNAIAKPISFAPDLWVGVTPRLTVGIVHSDPSLDRIQPGASLCLRRDPELCDATYRGGGLDARYLLIDHDVVTDLALAPRMRFLIDDLDPVKPALTLGGELRWQHGRYAVDTDPYLQLGVYNTGRGNRARLNVPIVVSIQPTRRSVVELHSGWNSDLAVSNDGWHVPVELAVRAAATSALDVGVALGFRTLLGPQHNSANRVVFLTLAWRSGR